MRHLYNYGAKNIRTLYSFHILRAHLQGFAPMSLRQFVAIAAPIELSNL